MMTSEKTVLIVVFPQPWKCLLAHFPLATLEEVNIFPKFLMESLKETNTCSGFHSEPMYTCKHWNNIHVSQFTWFFSAKGEWTMVIREVVKSDLLTYWNITDVTVDLILMVFCSVLPFTAFCFRPAHQTWAQVVNFSSLYAPPFAFFSLLFSFCTCPRDLPFWSI